MTALHDGSPLKILVTGASGYIGGRLVPLLIEAGYSVRVLVRDPDRLRDIPWASDVEVFKGDLLDPAALSAAFKDVDAAYYLVHSMGPGASRKTFSGTEQECATNFVAAAESAGVARFVYLSGLHPDGPLSPHLRSRTTVGNVLLESTVPAVVLQAGVVIGSGSASFEMIRHLTDVLPWMPAPKWVRNRVQPIAVRDVLYYLVHVLDIDARTNRTFDIGGPDVLSYADAMNGYAAEAGLPKRLILALPVLTPRLAAHWVNVVTPIPHSLAGPLVESLQHSCVVRERDLDALIPEPGGGRTGYRQAVRLALGKMRDGQVVTSWQNASVAGAPSDPLPSDPDWAGHSVYTDLRSRESDASVDQLWRVIEGIGGERGWYSFPLAWALRGWMDKFVGGVGLRRGRRDPNTLFVGEALDFWRVEGLDRGRLLRLRAEMKVPGRAWLELSAEPSDDGQGCRYQQRAIFFPRGLFGRLYWFSILPFHGIIFSGMANRIIQAAGAKNGE
ncbi:SDR family oxidoreductase [Leucobacter coleopterorum]|uniref:SDR family oxidoreductase n=1 Tax=Leucobacter coleopterorum TaxID=2714933 RepID=A0ABX6JVZ6_9MICO|nr:SDR family oxidoreductase [Leucobacter coleopterorum]QIM18474.1 SDR family oxidoreductase [Leucobacter coleopterorum]